MASRAEECARNATSAAQRAEYLEAAKSWNALAEELIGRALSTGPKP
jgi:hypothetical protein